jgi:FkbM family methyltransferase
MPSTPKELIRACLPRGVRPRRILAGPLRGQRLVTSWHDYPAALLGRTERMLLDWFQANVRAGETWLDIGAHYGYTALALCRLVGARGRVFAFEPMIKTAGHLSETRAVNGLEQLTVLPLALSAPTDLETQQLAVTRGMLDHTLEGGAWHETLVVARGDWLWPRICGGTPRFHGAKIDVQGMEIDVLRGMAATLADLRPRLVIELHRGVSRPELIEVLKNIGYCGEAIPVEPVDGETTPRFLDDRSYAFLPS